MEENKENVVEEVQQEQTTSENEDVVKIDLDKFGSKEDDSVFKVDLDKKEEEDAVQEQNTDEVPVRDESEASEEVREQDDEATIEEITGESEELTEEIVEKTKELEVGISESGNVEIKIPGNLEKLVEFMNETGGTLEDYVKLNKDYSEMDNQEALYEYYKRTKPHLSVDEINFLMEDQFNYDEEVDDEKDIKRKKLALKEQVANAKAYLDGQKSKYYDEVKAGSRLTPEAQEALEFYNRYNKESEQAKSIVEKQRKVFNEKTNKLFNDSFKGFEYNVGEKRFRFNVKNKEQVKTQQANLDAFMQKFLNEDKFLNSAADYHKSLFTAMNPDAIAQHFYEQGKADAIKESVAKAKNVNMEPRQSFGQVEVGGTKVRVIDGDSSSDFKFKIRKKK